MTVRLTEKEAAALGLGKPAKSAAPRKRVFLAPPPASEATARGVRLVIDWPPPGCSPNSRGKWMKIVDVKEYRYASYCIAHGIRSGCRREIGMPLSNPTVTPVFVVPTRRRYDLDNLMASIKAALDGLTDAGYWRDDSDIKLGAPRIEIKPGSSRYVVLEIKADAADRRDRCRQAIAATRKDMEAGNGN